MNNEEIYNPISNIPRLVGLNVQLLNPNGRINNDDTLKRLPVEGWVSDRYILIVAFKHRIIKHTSETF